MCFLALIFCQSSSQILKQLCLFRPGGLAKTMRWLIEVLPHYMTTKGMRCGCGCVCVCVCVCTSPQLHKNKYVCVCNVHLQLPIGQWSEVRFCTSIAVHYTCHVSFPSFTQVRKNLQGSVKPSSVYNVMEIHELLMLLIPLIKTD